MKKLNVNVKSVIVLTAICLIVTALLAVTNSFTAPVIKTMREQKEQASLTAVLPDSGSFTRIEELPENMPTTVKKMFKAEDGSYAVVLAATSAYSSGDMGITVGVGSDGKIVGIVLTSYQESKDFGKDTYPQTYVGMTDVTYASVDTFAGVTYSSKAFKNAIGDAFSAIKLIEGGEAR